MVKQSTVALSILFAALGAMAHGGEILLLDFSSPTCGPCQQMIPTISSLEQAGYPVRKVDVTQEPGLAERFRVTQVPCFVMLADGREVGRVVGATSRDRLAQMFQQAQRQASAVPDRKPINENDGRFRTQSPDLTPSTDPWTGVRVASPTPTIQTQGTINEPSRSSLLASGPSARETSVNELIYSSVRLRVDDATGHSYGTGTIIDTRSGAALVITCGHLFRESKGQGPVRVELFGVRDNRVQVVGEVIGEVFSYNLDRDIGLVSIRLNGSVRVAPVAPTDAIVGRGDRVTSVGCSHGEDPTALATRVTAINRYQGPPNIEASGAPVEGRSGGGLFNAAGELIGVCYAADYEGNEGLYAAIESIHDELDRVGLSEIYQTPAAAAQSSGALAVQAPTALPPVVRGQEPMQPVMPMDNATAVAPVAMENFAVRSDNPAAAPPGLNPVERAAWEEIMSRAATAEVICIIRPKEPGGKSEVITLDGVSPEFVRALANRPHNVSTQFSR